MLSKQENRQIIFNIAKEIENQRNKLPQELNEKVSNYLEMVDLKASKMNTQLLNYQKKNMEELRKRINRFLEKISPMDNYFPLIPLRNDFEMLDQLGNEIFSRLLKKA